MPIQVEITSTQSWLPIDFKAITGLVTRTLERESRSEAQIELLFVDNRAIHEINRSQLKHDWPTDVITFPLSNRDDSCLAGELVVSAEMAQEVAAELATDAFSELALYIVHGLLHMCGLDDTTPETRKHMRDRERYHLQAENIETPRSLAI